MGLLTKQISNDLSSIPESSPFRTEFQRVFGFAEELEPLCAQYLGRLVQGIAPTSGEIVDNGNWVDFCKKAIRLVLGIGVRLDPAGYGEIMERVKEEKTRQAREGQDP